MESGDCAVAPFGTSFTMEQVLALTKIHDKFFIVYDNEPQAQQQARKLAVKLKAAGKGIIETVNTDPGDMKIEDAKHFAKTLLKEVSKMKRNDLQERRKALGLSQMELAGLVGVSLLTIQLWERGVSEPKPENKERNWNRVLSELEEK